MFGSLFATMLAAVQVLSVAEPRLPLPTAVTTPPPRPEQVLEIPEALRTQFREQVLSRTAQNARRVEAVAEFMFNPEGLGMSYRHDATYTVAEAYQTRTANCLTFTLLTLALAREAGFEAYPQQLGEAVAWRQEGQTIYRTLHVNAGIRAGRRRLTVDVAWDRVISGAPQKRISDTRLLAQFYNNRSVELLAVGQLESARRYADISLALDPKYASSWSNAGVILLRAGQQDAAERDYLRALALDSSNAGALINLTAYYQRIGAPARALPFAQRLQAVRQSDPVYQYLRALDFENSGDLRQAVEYFQRAIRLYDREPHFHSGLARVYAMLGDERRAERALKRASGLSKGVVAGIDRERVIQ
jgi:tetratricopeptide (TPR) repeat protein